MKERWIALLYELCRTDDFRDAIKEISDVEAERAAQQQRSYLTKGDIHNACIACGQSIAWESLPKVLERTAKKGAPDNT